MKVVYMCHGGFKNRELRERPLLKMGGGGGFQNWPIRKKKKKVLQALHDTPPRHCTYLCCCACFGINNINISTRFDQIHQLFHKILSINIILKSFKGHNSGKVSYWYTSFTLQTLCVTLQLNKWSSETNRPTTWDFVCVQNGYLHTAAMDVLFIWSDTFEYRHALIL